jgi:GABA permease
MSAPSVEDTGLKRSLRQRHMTMISLGGVIGAGLFVGSGAVMNKTGPAAVVSYLLAGTLVVLIMRMLGEMAVANPAGSSRSSSSPPASCSASGPATRPA